MKYKYLFIFLACYGVACNNNSKQKEIKTPEAYDFTKPEKFVMPEVLHEISGIAFNNNDTVYAEQDEEGKVFHFKLGNENITTTKFGKKGDYEDIAISNGTIIMLRSDGVLFSFPVAETANSETSNVQEWKDLLPKGEYEGMYAVDSNLYVLCKHCSDASETKGYIFKISAGNITAAGNFVINVNDIETLLGEKKIKFHPSALAKNVLTNQWYILSSVNKLLVITDSNWNVQNAYPLDAPVFNQPEGIAFDKQGNLYISNEGGDSGKGTILKFYKTK